LSPRAYRKEVTRGVDELAERMRAVESGQWCVDREPVLKAYVAGVADEDQDRQARAHLAHCRPCSDFVARLSGHLHELGGSVAAIGAIDGLGDNLGLTDRLVALGDRAAALIGRGGSAGEGDTVGQVAASGGFRGAGAAGAGVLAKLATFGAAGKVALACVGGGIAATACVAAGVTPFGLGGDEGKQRSALERTVRERAGRVSTPTVTTETLPSEVDSETVEPPPVPAEQRGDNEVAAEAVPRSEPEPESTVPTVAPTAPPEEQEFGVAAVAAAPETPTRSSSPPTSSGGGGGGDPTPTEAAQQEFGP
jgi:hypothetical protein